MVLTIFRWDITGRQRGWTNMYTFSQIKQHPKGNKIMIDGRMNTHTVEAGSLILDYSLLRVFLRKEILLLSI